MGLLDGILGNVLGSVMGGGQAAGGNPMLNAVVGMLANGGAGQAGAGAMGAAGGLGALVGKFEQAGLGHVVQSWIGNGTNAAVTPDQITKVLGADQVSQIAQQAGISHGDAAGQLSQLLPAIINHLTPNGQAPAGGLGGASDIMGMLGGLLGKKA